MAWKDQEPATKRIDRFATEWALWDGDEDTGQQISEDARPERRAPVSFIDEMGRPAPHTAAWPRKAVGAASGGWSS